MPVKLIPEHIILLQSHPQPLEAITSLLRIHHHQSKHNLLPLYPVKKLAVAVGFAPEVYLQRYAQTSSEVDRGYRAALQTPIQSMSRGRPTRWVIELPNGSNKIVTY